MNDHSVCHVELCFWDGAMSRMNGWSHHSLWQKSKAALMQK